MVGYSAPEAAYEEYLEPGFQATADGESVDLSNSFGESAAQRAAVEDGQSASIIQVANAGEMEKLVEAGVVSKRWTQQQFRGIAQRSVIVIMVRKGNPRGIKSFDDLLNGSVEVLIPNPLTADAGPWSVMAIYGSLLRGGKSKAEALTETERMLEKAVAQPASGQAALDAFLHGQGDALVTYESEAIATQKAGKDIEYVLPYSTILVESPIAATKGAPAAAQEFLDYMWTTAGQELWTNASFRPVKVYVLDPIQFPREDLFKISGLGGWDKVDREFFDPQTGAIAKFERGLEGSSGG